MNMINCLKKLLQNELNVTAHIDFNKYGFTRLHTVRSHMDSIICEGNETQK